MYLAFFDFKKGFFYMQNKQDDQIRSDLCTKYQTKCQGFLNNFNQIIFPSLPPMGTRFYLLLVSEKPFNLNHKFQSPKRYHYFDSIHIKWLYWIDWRGSSYALKCVAIYTLSQQQADFTMIHINFIVIQNQTSFVFIYSSRVKILDF